MSEYSQIFLYLIFRASRFERIFHQHISMVYGPRLLRKSKNDEKTYRGSCFADPISSGKSIFQVTKVAFIKFFFH